MIIDDKTAGMLLDETIVALIIVVLLIVIKPKNPPAPQHPIPSLDPVSKKTVPADHDSTSRASHE
jgi:hypothetical protein